VGNNQEFAIKSLIESVISEVNGECGKCEYGYRAKKPYCGGLLFICRRTFKEC
jgi:hypothetical protein